MTRKKHLKIAIISDAYFPQVSGVATSISSNQKQLGKMGHDVRVISPRDFNAVIPLPGYGEIKLAFFAYRRLSKMLKDFDPDAIHISVEGPLGHAARAYCIRNNLEFTTAYHSRFPEYINIMYGVPISWSYDYLRWFHSKAKRVMVSVPSLESELEMHGFENLVLWPKGVDTELFKPDNPIDLGGEKPHFMYMGRVATEKSIEDFLELDLPGTKFVVGDGPVRAKLQKKYPEAVFTGYKYGEELAGHLAAADVFVFPSMTDTLGLVMMEANACGTPVAARPNQATLSLITDGVNGYLSHDLREACMKALDVSRVKSRNEALKHSWEASSKCFLEQLAIN